MVFGASDSFFSLSRWLLSALTISIVVITFAEEAAELESRLPISRMGVLPSSDFYFTGCKLFNQRKC